MSLVCVLYAHGGYLTMALVAVTSMHEHENKRATIRMAMASITREISQTDKMAFCQFRDIECPCGHITRPWGILSPPKTTTAALVP
jgi:hypothetical protein